MSAPLTVSGAGNGADMAVQLHVAFSRTISGACLRDAQPFHCATTRFPAEPLVDASHIATQLCDRRCESGRTLRFDHCRHDPASIDVGMLPDYPRRACGGDSSLDDGGGRVDGCLDDPRFLGESRVYLAPGADAAVTASTAGQKPLPSPSAHCTLPAPTASALNLCLPGSLLRNDAVRAHHATAARQWRRRWRRRPRGPRPARVLRAPPGQAQYRRQQYHAARRRAHLAARRRAAQAGPALRAGALV